MTNANYKVGVFVLTLAGVLFSGYLSSVRLFSNTCAFSEPCPYFLGYPACWFGFALFLSLYVALVVSLSGKAAIQSVAKFNLVISALGILFAGYFTLPEISHLLAGVKVYRLGLPTCAYGLIFYAIIFILSIQVLRNEH